MRFFEQKIPVFFFRGELNIPVGNSVAIHEIRFSYLEGAYEVNRVEDKNTGVVYEADRGFRLYELAWRRWTIIGQMCNITVKSHRTVFSLTLQDGAQLAPP